MRIYTDILSSVFPRKKKLVTFSRKETMDGDDNRIEICYECYFFRELVDGAYHTGQFFCVCKDGEWCDRNGVAKGTRACKHAKPRDWRPPSIIK